MDSISRPEPDYTVNQDRAHEKILKDAADIANHRAIEVMVQELPNVSSDTRVFEEANNRSGPSRLTLVMNETLIASLSIDLQQRLRSIASQALREAIGKNKELFVGLILGQARQGRNYFDQFSQGSDVG